MKDLFAGSELIDLITKVRAGERLGFADGVRLFNSNDLLAIGSMADIVRRRKNGKKVYFVSNRFIINAFTLSVDEIGAKAAETNNQRISEIHIVGGLNRELPLTYYLAAIQRVKKEFPAVNIQAFTVEEIDHFAQTSGLSAEKVLLELMEAGLGSLSGGDPAELEPEVKKQIYENQVSGNRWLEIMETAHGLGMRTNATMFYATGETSGKIVEQLLHLRQLQDKTNGFIAFVPMSANYATGFEDIKALAVARILLDNVDHVKAFWSMIGPKLAQVSLGFGVDELGEISQVLTKQELVRMIKAGGYEPVERDALYNPVTNSD